MSWQYALLLRDGLNIFYCAITNVLSVLLYANSPLNPTTTHGQCPDAQNHVGGSKEVRELGVFPSYMCAKLVYYLLRVGIF